MNDINNQEHENKSQSEQQPKKVRNISIKVGLNRVKRLIVSLSTSILFKIKAGLLKIKQYFKSLSKKNKIIHLIVISVLFVIILVFMIMSNVTSSNANSNANDQSAYTVNTNDSQVGKIAQTMQSPNQGVNQTNNATIQKELHELKDAVGQSTDSKEKVQELQRQLEQVSQSVQSLQQNTQSVKDAESDTQKLEAHNAQVADKNTKQLESRIVTLTKAVTPQKYLPVSDLPFKVVGVDYWGNQLMANVLITDVNGTNHYRLMGQGMSFDCSVQNLNIPSCTNWTLKAISNSPNLVVFENSQGKKIKVEL